MKKLLVVLLLFTAIGGIGFSGFMTYKYNTTVKEKEVLVQQNAALQSEIDRVGPLATVYTVANTVDWKNPISASDFVEMTIPQSSVTDDTVMSLSEIEGKLYKVQIQPGTPITKSLVMDENYDETIIEEDMTFDYLPLGLEVGDFVDIKIVLPYGETFKALSHIRVQSKMQETNIIKTYLTPAEKALWTSAQRDKDLWGQKGLTVICEKYVEPGASKESVAFYPVRSEMEAVVNADPNIKNKKECINSALRKQFDLMLSVVDDQDGSASSAGNSLRSSSINTAASTYKNEVNTTANVNSGTESELMSFDEPNGDSQGTTPTDAYGNSSAITPEQMDKADGDSIFKGETILE